LFWLRNIFRRVASYKGSFPVIQSQLYAAIDRLISFDYRFLNTSHSKYRVVLLEYSNVFIAIMGLEC